MELTRDEANELLGAYVLDALDEDDRVAFERRLDRDPDLVAATAELLEAAGLLGAAEADAPPASLAERTLAAAFTKRPPGTPAIGRDDPVGAFRGQMDDLSFLLSELEGDDWQAITLYGWTVHELVAHLLAVEGYLGHLLGVAPPAPELAFEPQAATEHDHLGMTEPTIAEWSTGDPAATVAAWRALVDANLAHLESLGDERLADRLAFHGLDLSLRSLLGVRTFEVWTHTDDIRRALKQPLQSPGPARLRFMSELAVGALPLGLMLAGIDDPGRTVRVVLTGAGGGEWLQPLTLGAEPGAPDATLVADVVDFCRLAAKRLTADEIPHHAEGDPEVIRDVLVGARVFAA